MCHDPIFNLSSLAQADFGIFMLEAEKLISPYLAKRFVPEGTRRFRWAVYESALKTLFSETNGNPNKITQQRLELLFDAGSVDPADDKPSLR